MIRLINGINYMRISLFLLFFMFCLAEANEGYEFSGQIKNCEACKRAFLYKYDGSRYSLIDSTDVSGGSFKFVLSDSISPAFLKVRFSAFDYFEGIIFNDEDIVVKSDLKDLKGNLRVISSRENKIYREYLSFVDRQEEKGKKLSSLISLYGPEDKFYSDIIKESNRLKEENATKIDEFVSKYDGTIAAKAISYEQIPRPQSSAGALVTQSFLRNNYLNNIDFADSNLIYYPFLQSKVNDYLALFRDANLSSLEQERRFRIPVDTLLKRSEKNEVLLKFLVEKLLKVSDEYGLNDLYCYIAGNYAEKAFKNDATKLKRIERKASEASRLRVGEKAPDFAIGGDLNLYEIKRDKILLIFWDSDCSSCEDLIRKLKKIYEEKKLNGAEVVAVSLDVKPASFRKAIIQNGLRWINYCDYQGWESEVAKSYSVDVLPSMFLLDERKKIIARPGTVSQLLKAIEK